MTDVGAAPAAALDPELDRVVRAMPDFGTEARLDDLALIRSLRDTPAMLAALGRSLPLDDRVAVENREVPGRTADRELLVRVYRPTDADGGALVFLHGGAYVLGDVYVEEQRCLHLAAETGAVVVSVEYALAPEEPFPAGLEDAYAALRWASDGADVLGVDRGRIAVGGSSAGAGLAAALALLARRRGGPEICFQLLVYPMLDDRMESPSMQLRGTPLFSRRAAADAWGHYLGDREADELAAPARAERLAGLPPAYLMVAEQDPLRDEGIAYATALTRAGVECELHLLPGTFHGFDLVCPRSALGRRALEEQATALRRGLARSARPVGPSSRCSASSEAPSVAPAPAGASASPSGWVTAPCWSASTPRRCSAPPSRSWRPGSSPVSGWRSSAGSRAAPSSSSRATTTSATL